MQAGAEQSKQLVIQFIQDFLQIQFDGLQSGFGFMKDQILFRSPRGSTLSIPTDTMLLPCEVAREIVRRKIADNEKAFERKVA